MIKTGLLGNLSNIAQYTAIVGLVAIEGPTHPRQRLSVVLLFSGDGGVMWLPVRFDPAAGELSVEAARLPGGERWRFRAIADAELQSAIPGTRPFELVPATRRLYLVTPRRECGIAPSSVALSALIDTRARAASSPRDSLEFESAGGDQCCL